MSSVGTVRSEGNRLGPSVVTGREFASMRTVVIVSMDAELRSRLRSELAALRWQVREASGGAEAAAHLESARAEAMLLDDWLPDLEVGEFASQLVQFYPAMDLIRMDGTIASGVSRSPRRNELLHALREAQESMPDASTPTHVQEEPERAAAAEPATAEPPSIAGMIGRSELMCELARMIHLVAPRSCTVLIEGETGTGKEVVARALHRFSSRAQKSFTVLNCAAIPETLLEAELFGHARGAFTGAVSNRTGRIEAADGGTLFLDEIGEMPLALQAKMLRFLESGELQRVGDNELTRVDVRIIAATHQPLEQQAEQRLFRLDLYHRLAVFPIEVPPLRDRKDDLPLLVEHLLERLGHDAPRKRILPEAMTLLLEHRWPGNVRELMHVLERAVILSCGRPEIGAAEIRIRRSLRTSQ